MHALPLSRAASCAAIAALVLLATTSTRAARAAEQGTKPRADETAPHDALRAFCANLIGAPRIVNIAPGVLVAVGYDVANVTAIDTPDGMVVIDTGSCTSRAAEIRQALSEHVSGPVRAVIYTHHQIEQTGGAGVWTDEPDVEIWATASMPGAFHRQYMLLDRSKLRRGIRQFGLGLSEQDRIPSALGRNPAAADLNTVPAVRMPTQTVEGEAEFEIGGLTFHLIEAPGETADHLLVWIPSLGVLVAGDNFARGFPEMYSVRGTPPEPPDAWIGSLDRMRGLEPEHLVAARHQPISGAKKVQMALTNYRDLIQWLRDETLRAIGRGDSIIVYISDEGRQFNVTVRRGVVEVDEGTPLPRMPKPVAILVTDGLTWRKLCMGVISPAVALATRKLDVQGNRFAAHRFAMRFECEPKFEDTF